jgi:L-ribulose-5-phosphate 3-epimerase
LEVLADLGYGGVAITPDVGPLDPLSPDPGAVTRVARTARRLGLELVLESGARYLLDPRRKHWPTLLEEGAADRARRAELLSRSIRLAADLGATVLSLWSGRAPDGSTGDGPPTPAAERLFGRLAAGLRPLLAEARQCGVRLGFEPEPGMFLERPAGYLRLLDALGGDGAALGLTLDVGHCVCTGDVPLPPLIRELAPRIVTVQLDDMLPGVHEHLMFGRGALDLRAVLAALGEVGFEGLAAVELARESHRAPLAAAEALEHLRRALP